MHRYQYAQRPTQPLYTPQRTFNPHFKNPLETNKWQLHIWNTRKISYFAIYNESTKPYYFCKLHKRDYNFFTYRAWQSNIIRELRKILKKGHYYLMNGRIIVMPGFAKFNLQTLTWMLMRSYGICSLLNLYIYIPRAHGYRTLTKIARRKRRFTKICNRRRRRAR